LFLFHIEHTTMYNIFDELRAAKRAKTSHQPSSALRAASAGMTATAPSPSPKSTARLPPNAATSLMSPVTTATMPNRGTLAFTATTMPSIDSSLPHLGQTLDVFAGQSARAVLAFHVGGDQGASWRGFSFDRSRYLDRWILDYQASVLPRATDRDGESVLACQCSCVVAGIRWYEVKRAYTKNQAVVGHQQN